MAKKKVSSKPKASSKCPGCGESFKSDPQETAIMRPQKTDSDALIRVCGSCSRKIDKFNTGSLDGLKRLQKMQVPN